MTLKAKNTYAPLPTTVRGKSCFINGDPKGVNFVYCAGNTVVIRNISNPLLCDFYQQHARPPTVAAYAPSGNYIASGDVSGMVRVWDTINAEHILKLEVAAIAGEVRDISWTGDSTRIVAVGDGRESFGKAFSWDSGTNVGTIGSHEKRINTCAAKPQRPFRVVTGSEDNTVNWYEGPPFVYKAKKTDHSRFVNCVRYSANGDVFASCGSDKKIFLYNGKTGESLSELVGHDGGVYCLSFSPDSNRLLTASADRTCKVWDIATASLLTTFQLEKTVENQQLGCLWQGDNLLGVGLDGIIRYFDEANPDRPRRVLYGHQVYTTAVAYDASSESLITASYDAKVTRWNESTGESVWLSGKGHTNSVQSLALSGGDLVSGSMDDSVRFTPLDSFTAGADAVKTDGPVAAVASSSTDNVTVALSNHTIYVLKGKKVVSETPAPYNPVAVALHPNGTTVAVGGEDKKLRLFSLSGSALTAQGEHSFNGSVENVAFSGDGNLIAIADRERFIKVFRINDLTDAGIVYNSRVHNARIHGIAFSPDSQRLATVSQDSRLVVHGLHGEPRLEINTHRMGATSVIWLNQNTLATTGQDCSIKTFTLA